MNIVLVVADDAGAARTIADVLTEAEGFQVSHAGCVAEAVAHDSLQARRYDAVVLICSGPAAGSPAACARLRQIWSHCPILVAARDAGECDVVASLDAGASDFVSLPYRAVELRARMRAQIRAFANSAAHVFHIGPHRFDPSTRSLHNATAGTTVKLTHKETELLKFLYRAQGTTVARQTMLREVWGYRDGADSYTVESHIYRLRRKLEADPARPHFLLSEEGGYMLTLEPARPWPPLRVVPPVQLAG